MIFEVTRTTCCLYDDPKIEGAQEKEIPRLEISPYKSAKEYNKHLASDRYKWEDAGNGHFITPEGYIARFHGSRKIWVIDINTLEELMKFKEKYHNEVIIGNSFTDPRIPLIEIYDGYRE